MIYMEAGVIIAVIILVIVFLSRGGC